MKKALLYLSACITLTLAGLWQPAQASHMVGEDLTWECINNCTTRVYLRVYRDCTGASGITNNINFTTSVPGCVVPTALTGWSAQVTTEVTPICPSVQTQCTTPNATIAGVQEYFWFRDYNVCNLGTGCTYNVSWGSCCRNASITSGAANQGMGISNFMDLSLGCNNSPQFTNNPLFMACAGQPYTIHQGAYDPDGDSLTFSLSPCMTDANTQVSYGVGYSPTAPLGTSWTVNFNQLTGMLELVPNPGNIVTGVVCIAVNEWRNGNLIGTTFRDMQIQVINCPANAQPAYSAFTNFSPGASLISPDVISYCGVGTVCFDIGVTDPDSLSQTVTLTWDQNIAGATFSEVQNPAVMNTISGNSPDGRFCWTPTAPGVYQFLLSASDNACPLFGLQDKLVTILVGSGTAPTPVITATGTLDTCNGTTVTLDAGGGYSSYLWSTAAATQTITVGTAGTYSVTVSNSGCTGSASYTVLNQPVPQITGTLFTSTAASLVNQKVYLIRHDATLNGLYAEDSTITDAFGNYAFCGVTLDTMYIKAAPDSAIYPGEMPTYADTAVWWNNAEMVLAANFPVVKSFQTRSGSNPGGNGFIGGLISQGANKTNAPGDPMPNVTVILYSKTLSQFVDMTVSDANGYFFFADIPLGDYEVSVDVAGVDHINVPSVLLDASTPTQDSLDFRLHTTYFELYLATDVAIPALANIEFDAFPNPVAIGSAQGATTIRLNLPQQSQVELMVYDIRGAKVASLASGLLKEGAHQWTFDGEERGLGAGIYFLHLQTPQGNRVIKLIQMEK
jgi:hypothetical protein